ncbi:N-acetylmuramidase domain-containing protein [Pseudomonas sp. 43NM1]|uniref:N-acetylmuramidase domain-containing protein n=1 Tax=Pseudomonas sp. 43NM1 TaxID=1904755 RepID=UPI000C3439E6|nr:N-acetylmuramidase domain-containing protein [Pseudomonas sp. 43NM1]
MTEPLDLSGLYTGGDYRYKLEGDGFTIENGKKIIDCSHMVYLLMKGAGYNITYENTSAMANSTYYEQITDLATVKRGDVALWLNATGHTPAPPLNHTGIIATFDGVKNGTFFGAQSSGVATANFGDRPHSGFWPRVTKVLRIKEQYRTGTQPAPVATPAPAPVGPEPLMNFQYPFRKADGKQFTDSEEVYKALENETSGNYLLGSHSFWHGGIHITNKSAPQCISDEPVRCMGDGVVVAYRLNKDYLTSEFVDEDSCETLKYSSSFCLVRHDYKSPVSTEGAPGACNELTLYSLYMHLLPFDRYPTSPDEVSIPRIKMVAGGFKARSDIKGAAGCEEYGAISAGAEIEILEEHSDHIHAKGKLIAGSVVGRTTGQEFWFAYKQNGLAYPKSDGAPSWKALVLPERTKPGYWKGKVRAVVAASGLTLRQPPAALTNGVEAGPAMSAAASQGGTKNLVLCTSSTIEFDSGKIFNLKVGHKTLRMAECTFIPSTSGAPTGLKSHSFPVPDTFWACVEDISPNQFVQWQGLTPSVFDEVVLMDTAIKAGDPIGYLGLNENISGPNGGASSKYQVHVEIFSADPRVEDFLKNKAGISGGKQYVHLPANTSLTKRAPQSGTIELSNEHFVELRKTVLFKDTVEWYEITIVDNGEIKSGLVKKETAKLLSQHDWEKLGFRVVKESNQNADGFLDPDDMPEFFKTLYNDLDKFGNQDTKVTVDDLSIALKNSEMRDHWSKLIADHPTEWKSKSDTPKWARLGELLGGFPAVLKHEKERIDKLVFWDDLTGNAQVGNGVGVVAHFHPIALVSNMLPGNRCFCFEQGIVDSPCQKGIRDVTKEHFELLAAQLGVEREVLRAIAVAETGDKVPFKEYVAGKQHATILYERHYMYRLLNLKGYTNVQLDEMAVSEPKIVHRYQSGYSYGSEQAQYERLVRASEIDKEVAIKSCSWGKFQVMGEYFARLYKSSDELVEAQNYCALQHLQYFKIFLTKEKNMLEPMRQKNWLTIAKKYNGENQIGYDINISNAYDQLKANW